MDDLRPFDFLRGAFDSHKTKGTLPMSSLPLAIPISLVTTVHTVLSHAYPLINSITKKATTPRKNPMMIWSIMLEPSLSDSRLGQRHQLAS